MKTTTEACHEHGKRLRRYIDLQVPGIAREEAGASLTYLGTRLKGLEETIELLKVNIPRRSAQIPAHQIKQKPAIIKKIEEFKL